MIAETALAQVRDRTDIVALIGETMRLTRRGRSYLGLCPFHQEKSPSFSVNQERGYFYCFGCKEHGSAIDFVMKLEGKSFPDAVRQLAERAGVELQEAAPGQRDEADAERREREELYAVSALAATFYEHSLRGGPGMRPHPQAHHAAEELARRGLPLDDTNATVDGALRAFRIGYAPHGWDGLVRYLEKHGVSPVVAERVGLVSPRQTGGGYYDRFRHRLMFAVVDVSGRVIAFSGRALPEPEGAGHGEEKPAKYINSPESPIYTKGEHLFGLYQARQAIRQRGEAVLVEGNFDVVALHARGIGCVVAPLGTAFTEHQAKLLKRFAPSVTVMFDGDSAGKKATWAARVPCRTAGLSARAVVMPKGQDPDEIAQKQGAGAVAELLTSAPSLTQRLLDLLLKEGEVSGGAIRDQLARVRAAVQLIGEGEDAVEKAMLRSYADQIAASLVVGNRAPSSLGDLEGMLRGGRRSSSPATAPVARGSIADEMGRAMFGALLDCPSLLDDAEVEQGLSLLDGPAALAVLGLRRAREAAPEEIVGMMPEEMKPYAARRLARPVWETQAEAKRDFLGTAHTLSKARALAVG